jgi:hypothetical protein
MTPHLGTFAKEVKQHCPASQKRLVICSKFLWDVSFNDWYKLSFSAGPLDKGPWLATQYLSLFQQVAFS